MVWKFRVGDGFQSDMANQYELTVDLGEHMFDGAEDDQCWMPVFTTPDLTGLPELEKQKRTWFVGTALFANYFTVFDERPVVDELGTRNFVGLAPCAHNSAHADLTGDQEGIHDDPRYKFPLECGEESENTCEYDRGECCGLGRWRRGAQQTMCLPSNYITWTDPTSDDVWEFKCLDQALNLGASALALLAAIYAMY